MFPISPNMPSLIKIRLTGSAWHIRETYGFWKFSCYFFLCNFYGLTRSKMTMSRSLNDAIYDTSDFFGGLRAEGPQT